MSFKKPTLRTRRRFTFHDAGMPMAAPAKPRPVARTTWYAPSPEAASDDGQGISTLTDEERTVTLTLPPNWNEHDVAQLMQAMVEQNNQRLYFGAVEPTPRHLGELDPSEDYPSEDQSPLWESHLVDDADSSADPTSRYGKPTLDPESMHIGTSAGTTPPGSRQTLLLSLPLNGVQDVYHCRTDPNGFHVFRRTTNDPMRSTLVQSFPISKDAQMWWEETATHLHVWKMAREKPLDLKDPSATSDGAAYGTLKASYASDRAKRIRSMNDANKAAWSGKGR